jgi:nitrite reductase/ring-hydroxylating ferredoxin subunit
VLGPGRGDQFHETLGERDIEDHLAQPHVAGVAVSAGVPDQGLSERPQRHLQLEQPDVDGLRDPAHQAVTYVAQLLADERRGGRAGGNGGATGIRDEGAMTRRGGRSTCSRSSSGSTAERRPRSFIASDRVPSFGLDGTLGEVVRLFEATGDASAWYVAARSNEVSRTFLPRWLLGDPVVMYRREDGTPVALVDRCIHRQMPLSLGRLRGDEIECGYHGLTFAPDGRCVRIPGSPRISDRARVQGFPLYEEFAPHTRSRPRPRDADASPGGHRC